MRTQSTIGRHRPETHDPRSTALAPSSLIAHRSYLLHALTCSRAHVLAAFAALTLIALPGTAGAQSLFLVPPQPPPLSDEEEYDPASPVYAVSLISVQPPQPPSYKVHDLVTIVIDETSRQTAEQKLKAEKEFELDAQMGAILDFIKLLEGRLEASDQENVPLIRTDYNGDFDGKGRFERNDRFNARITAEIIDLKPNGTLVLEARKRIDKGEEIQEMVLSGVCRREDITTNNTILSSQLASMTLISRHEGPVEDVATKGIITKVLEFLFAF